MIDSSSIKAGASLVAGGIAIYIFKSRGTSSKAAAPAPAAEDSWKAEVAESRPWAPVLWGWAMNATLLAVQTFMVTRYAPSYSPSTYVATQLVTMTYSWVATNLLFPLFPTVAGLPFFLVAFPPAFGICAAPFFAAFGKEFAMNAPIWVLTAWSAVRLMFESIVQMHAAYGVKGISYWLLWPIQKAPEPYTYTYPFFGWKVARTRGGNVDAMTSLCVCLPVALVCAIVNDDASPAVRLLSWAAQSWIFVYLCCLGPVPHFLMGMPGPNNIFDGEGEPKRGTQMHALTSGTLGVCCYWIASYAVIHFIVFVRKMTGV